MNARQIVSIVGLLFAATPAHADCPDKPVSCDLGAVGTQGTCWHATKFRCEDCGPRHCPTPPTTVPTTYSYPCIEIVQADHHQCDGCSNPLTDPLDSLYKTLFYPACFQHDTCYHNNIGIPKEKCDEDFKANMTWICRNYYSGLVNDAQLGACLAAVGTWFETVSKAPLAKTLWDSDHAWTDAHCHAKAPEAQRGPAKLPEPEHGPAKLPEAQHGPARVPELQHGPARLPEPEHGKPRKKG